MLSRTLSFIYLVKALGDDWFIFWMINEDCLGYILSWNMLDSALISLLGAFIEVQTDISGSREFYFEQITVCFSWCFIVLGDLWCCWLIDLGGDLDISEDQERLENQWIDIRQNNSLFSITCIWNRHRYLFSSSYIGCFTRNALLTFFFFRLTFYHV